MRRFMKGKGEKNKDKAVDDTNPCPELKLQPEKEGNELAIVAWG